MKRIMRLKILHGTPEAVETQYNALRQTGAFIQQTQSYVQVAPPEIVMILWIAEEVKKEA